MGFGLCNYFLYDMIFHSVITVNDFVKDNAV